jgi:hypothetical protein
VGSKRPGSEETTRFMDNENTPGKEFYRRQLQFLQQMDLDGLVNNQYTEDAELIGFGFQWKGRQAIHDHFVNYMKMLGHIDLNSTDKWNETDDSIFFEATMTTNLGIAHVYDAFVFRDGKASHHFTGVSSVSPLPEQNQ